MQLFHSFHLIHGQKTVLIINYSKDFNYLVWETELNVMLYCICLFLKVIKQSPAVQITNCRGSSHQALYSISSSLPNWVKHNYISCILCPTLRSGEMILYVFLLFTNVLIMITHISGLTLMCFHTESIKYIMSHNGW